MAHHKTPPTPHKHRPADTDDAAQEPVTIPRNRPRPIHASIQPVDAAYFNRELSWLAFNRRVLELAQNTRLPLLERVRFIAIVSSNLDEFFEIRVAGLIQQLDSGRGGNASDKLGPHEQLRRIHSVVAALVEDQYRCWHEQLVPALAEADLLFKCPAKLSPNEQSWLKIYFDEQIFPVLTPLAIDQAHPFPQLGNKTLNIVVSLRDSDHAGPHRLLAILPVPRLLPRFVPIGNPASRPCTFIFLPDILKHYASACFPGYMLESAHTFRVTRNSDLYINEEESENLLQKIEQELHNLRRGAAVRLEIEEGVNERVFATLCEHLELSHEYTFRLDGPINLSRLMSLTELERPDLKFPPTAPANVSPLSDPDHFFDTMRAQDVLLHHPYDSFQPVIDFVGQSARDPDVLAIKQTLYRTSGDSPIVKALIDASHRGKQVTAMIELTARFDEANNIHWAKQLEEAGVHVVYGPIGHKTHCKCTLVIRREDGRLQHYVHLGTGNYNPRTARLYTDLSFFTADETIAEDVATLFNALTGFSRAPHFKHLLVAPYNLHERIQSLIRREQASALAGKPARIVAKMNALVDRATIDSLYAASQAGVKIDLIVRGICCLVPGVRGLSENIRVHSIVGRFLEHGRAYYFANSGGESEVYLGSPDWMPRNFFRRIEIAYPVKNPSLKKWLIEQLLETELRDTAFARELQPNGAYRPRPPEKAQAPFSAQEHFLADALHRSHPPKKPPRA